MHWLQSLDVYLFHWVNPALRSSLLDAVMPFCSGNRYFVPALLAALVALMIWGGARGRVCVLMVVAAVALSDGLVCNSLKHLIARPRPFFDVADAHVPDGIGRTGSGSMPSSHAANWFAATMVVFVYYRRGLWLMLPPALVVSFSRVYNGVHYPSDVLVGIVLGSASGFCAIYLVDALWRRAGQRWLPHWWQRLPSLANPNPVYQPGVPATPAAEAAAPDRERQWLHLGYALILAHLIANLIYLATARLGLSADEAYQWVWSKHLALSYYSKPPMIAYTQFLGTTLWGDNAFGVRFFSPVIAALINWCMLRFLSRVANARAGFWLCVMCMLTPLLAVGSILMTIDPLSVLFWNLALIAGWRAVQENSRDRDWLWVGLWMGLGLLSKYTALMQLLSWAVFFAFWPPARKQLARRGPWFALLVMLVCALPIVIWNYQHDWITVHHVASGGNLDKHWDFTPANLWRGFSRYTLEFIGGETFLLNPFFVVPAAAAAIVFWRRQPANPLLRYLFSMMIPAFAIYFLLSFRSRILLNWIAPSVVPLFCLAAIYWDGRWREGFRPVKTWLAWGASIGLVAVVILHEPRLVTKVSGWEWPPKLNPLRRVEGWSETAAVVEAARQKLAAEGKPVFIICGHYGITGEFTFELPEARAAVCKQPLVYYQSSSKPENQFYYWPGYQDRSGQNAIYVQELDLLGDKTNAVPASLKKEFESVTDLGVVMVKYRDRPIRRLQLTECRHLR